MKRFKQNIISPNSERGIAELYIVLISSIISLMISILLKDERLNLQRISAIKNQASTKKSLQEDMANQLIKLDRTFVSSEPLEYFEISGVKSDIEFTSMLARYSTDNRLPNWTKLLEAPRYDACTTTNTLCILNFFIPQHSQSYLGPLEIKDSLIVKDLKDRSITISIYGSLRIENTLILKNLENCEIELIAKDDVFIAGINFESVKDSNLLIHSSLESVKIINEHHLTKISDSEFAATQKNRSLTSWPLIRILGDYWEKT